MLDKTTTTFGELPVDAVFQYSIDDQYYIKTYHSYATSNGRAVNMKTNQESFFDSMDVVILEKATLVGR